MKKISALLLTTAALTGCGQTLDFRNAEISSNTVYEKGANEPYSGSLTNVPLGVAPPPKIGELLKFAGDATQDRSVAGTLFGAGIAQLLGAGGSEAAVVCDVEVNDGKLEGQASCHFTRTGTPVYEYAYVGSTPTGDLKVYSAKHEGKLLIEAALDENGVVQGESKVYNPETGNLLATGEWKDGKLDGELVGYDLETSELVRKGRAVNGLLEGEFLTYSPDGDTLIKKQTFKAGKLHGPVEEYDADGKVIRKSSFENGQDLGLLASYRQEAEALIAAGREGELDWVIESVRRSRECIARQEQDPNETRTREQIEESCGLETPQTLAAEAQRRAADERAWAEQSAADDAAAAAADAAEAQAGSDSPDLTPPTAKASFDCAKASSSVEKMICGSYDLAAADVSLSEAYKGALSCSRNRTLLKATQRAWSRERDACSSAACVSNSYEARRLELIKECAG